MSKPRMSATAHEHVDTDVTLRAAAIGGTILGILLALSYLFIPNVLGYSKFAKAAQIGIELFIMWLVITSTIRGIHNLRARTPGWKLLVGGCLTAIFGPLVRELTLRIVANFNESVDLEPFEWKGLLFFAGLGLLAALIALIRLRVRNRALGNMLEFGLIALVAFLVFQFMK
jgi:predicted membrane protein